jgi:hypothetical protein
MLIFKLALDGKKAAYQSVNLEILKIKAYHTEDLEISLRLETCWP